MISSPTKGDGKTTVSVHLAAALAKDGQDVVLIDADLRHPQVAARLGIEPLFGLSEVITNQGELSDALVEVDVGDGRLRVLAAGGRAPNPARLLSSRSMRALLLRLSRGSRHRGGRYPADPQRERCGAAARERVRDGSRRQGRSDDARLAPTRPSGDRDGARDPARCCGHRFRRGGLLRLRRRVLRVRGRARYEDGREHRSVGRGDDERRQWARRRDHRRTTGATAQRARRSPRSETPAPEASYAGDSSLAAIAETAGSVAPTGDLHRGPSRATISDHPACDQDARGRQRQRPGPRRGGRSPGPRALLVRRPAPPRRAAWIRAVGAAGGSGGRGPR